MSQQNLRHMGSILVGTCAAQAIVELARRFQQTVRHLGRQITRIHLGFTPSVYQPHRTECSEQAQCINGFGYIFLNNKGGRTNDRSYRRNHFTNQDIKRERFCLQSCAGSAIACVRSRAEPRTLNRRDRGWLLCRKRSGRKEGNTEAVRVITARIVIIFCFKAGIGQLRMRNNCARQWFEKSQSRFTTDCTMKSCMTFQNLPRNCLKPLGRTIKARRR